MRAAGRVGRTVVLRLRFDDFSRATRSHTLPQATAHTQTILVTARGLLAAAMPTIERRGITLVGVAVANLANAPPGQRALPCDRMSGDALDAAVDEVREHGAGAIASFTGVVRNRNVGRRVLFLEYEAYEGMAEKVMQELADELRRRYDLCEIAIHHRVGRVEVGEPSIVIAVSSPHRAAALAACREAIDTLKETVPLWKKEVYEGGEEWIGRGS